jgi:hypothetical protein
MKKNDLINMAREILGRRPLKEDSHSTAKIEERKLS